MLSALPQVTQVLEDKAWAQTQIKGNHHLSVARGLPLLTSTQLAPHLQV